MVNVSDFSLSAGTIDKLLECIGSDSPLLEKSIEETRGDHGLRADLGEVVVDIFERMLVSVARHSTGAIYIWTGESGFNSKVGAALISRLGITSKPYEFVELFGQDLNAWCSAGGVIAGERWNLYKSGGRIAIVEPYVAKKNKQ